MDFVSFHTHSSKSYGDGFGTVRQHVERVRSLGMSALALSEHGNVSSHVALERECNAAGIKPIFGIEAYFGPTSIAERTKSKTHLTIFAENDEGYHNLNQLVTQSWKNFYQKPTIWWDDLERYSAGLIVFSGCADSFLSCTLLGGKFIGEKRSPDDDGAIHYSDLRRRLRWFSDVFPGRFYLECQRFPQLERTCAINAAFARASKDTGIPLIATADVHYPFRYQNVMQTSLHAANRGGTAAISDAEWEYDVLLAYPESDQEIINDLIATGLAESEARAAVYNTRRLAEKCTVALPKARPLRFPGVRTNAIVCGPQNSTMATKAKNNEPITKAGGKLPSGTGNRDSKLGPNIATENQKRQASKEDLEQVRIFATQLHFKKAIQDGWRYRCKQRPDLKKRVKEYNARVQHEMNVIVDKDFMDYFLVTSDLVSYTKDQNAGVGPARGSAAGSLICYLLRITEIDPLYSVFNKMLFERFLDKTRMDPPDIDLDFDEIARPIMVGRALEVYGEGHVANVGNHERYRGTRTINAMAKAHAYTQADFKAVKDRIQDRVETDERVDDTILDVVENYSDNEEVAAVIDRFWWANRPRAQRDGQNQFVGPKDQIPGPLQLATWLEGNDYGLGVHAAGFVISSDPITDTCAYYTRESGTGRKRKTVSVIPYDKRDAEYLNLLKFDFLGLTTMGVLRSCGEMVGMTMEDIYKILPPEGDLRDYDHSRPLIERFLADDLVGVFQFEGGTTRRVLGDVQPTEFRHLADINALSRPGPKYGGQTARYINVKANREPLELIHPLYDQHVSWSYGQIVYQEQIMFILRDLAGFPIEKVLKVRKIIGKKLGEHQFAAIWADFRDGCASNGVDENIASRIWAVVRSSAMYAFNTSHSYSYSWIAWLLMWFKVYHPEVFFANTLAYNGDGKDDKPRRTRLLQDLTEHGRKIEVLPINPKLSSSNWTPNTSFTGITGIDAPFNNGIRPGFAQIPGIAEAAKDIVSWRDEFVKDGFGKRSISWSDLAKVNGIGKATTEKMKAFAEKADPFDIHKVANQLVAYRQEVASGKFAGTPLPQDIDEYALSNELPSDDHCAWVGFVNKINFRDEIDNERRKTGKSVDEIKENMTDPDLSKKVVMFSYDEVGEIALRINRWRLPKLVARVDNITEDHHIVVAWGKIYDGNERSMQVKALWILDPD